MENRHKSPKSELGKCNKFQGPNKANQIASLTTRKCPDHVRKTENANKTCRECCGETFLKCNYKYKRRSKSSVQGDVPKVDCSNKISNCCSSWCSRSRENIEEIRAVDYLKWTLCRYVPCAKMLNICSLNIIVIIAIIMLGVADVSEAGICWTTRESSGKCTQRFSSNMSEEECCKHPSFAYTEREMSDTELFFAAAINDGAVCKSCLDSCEAAKCGTGKRCVYRKGRPKCVCAPVCRSSKQKNRSSNTKGFLATTPTNSPPIMLPKEQRPFPSFFNFGGMDFDAGNTVPGRSSTNHKNSTSINTNNNNSEVRWRRDSNEPVVEALKSNRNETDHLTSTKRRKNQRKSKNSSKRRKNSTTKSPSSKVLSSSSERHAEDAEATANVDHQGDSPKSGRIIIMADNSERSLKETSLQDGKLSNSSSTPHGTKQTHHNRHQLKRDQQKHHSKATDSGQSAVLLDEKIRSGFFNHGFPYPSVDDVQQHGHGRYYNPVCGTDGKTYKTECQLKKRACRRESTTLAVAYRGHCQTSCKLVRCLNNLTCVEDQYGLPHCISCTISCPQDDATPVIDPSRAVCGVDGLTYKSICDINRLICTTGRSIAVAYYGLCKDEANCNTIQCRDKEICLNDLQTNKPRCISCSFKCPRKRRPQGQRYQEHKICGTNNLSYHSWCQMRRESCNTGFYIDVKHVGTCHKSSAPSKPKYT
ncbi:uncharacterized protein LOC119661170 isoform X2 [Hermetia illucens]|uniref:uncharacterized protein LOC119661170 isoform X2 n=1 Tax=Hermetia illucens TaxID=343691 RepID=UPI0018CBF2CC|nr:uncharacterized protein LOC119661170 isoform X2 [Hermetia illucens]